MPSSVSHFFPCSGSKPNWFKGFQWRSLSPAIATLGSPSTEATTVFCLAERATACCAHSPAPASRSSLACSRCRFRYGLGTMWFKTRLFFFQRGFSRSCGSCYPLCFPSFDNVSTEKSSPCCAREVLASRHVPAQAGTCRAPGCHRGLGSLGVPVRGAALAAGKARQEGGGRPGFPLPSLRSTSALSGFLPAL